jgi:4-alpha-glucanotransferase
MEQVNQPANPRHYWRYRMHINIEDMQRATAFNEKVRALSQRKN